MEAKRLDLSDEQRRIVDAGGRVNSFYDVYDGNMLKKKCKIIRDLLECH